MWTGTWVAERLGVELAGQKADDELRGLLGLALRRNPRRAHLLVSNVLGKHVPQSPAVVRRSGYELGCRVRALLGEAEARRAVVLGYAETATGLGHCVADGLAHAPYLHSTRRPVPGVRPAGGFEESHSHHTSHLLLPEDPELLARPGPLVLVDDEFSTGNTVLNTVRTLHERYARERYVIVALVDMRSEQDRGRLAEFAAEIGARVDLVTLAAGTVRLPDGVLEKGQALVAAHETPPPDRTGDPRAVRRVDLGWPAGVPDGGRHGFTPAHRARLEAALPAMAARLAAALGVADAPADPHADTPPAAPAPGASAPEASGAPAPGAPVPEASGAPAAGASVPEASGAPAAGASVPEAAGAPAPGAPVPAPGAPARGASAPGASAPEASDAAAPEAPGAPVSEASGASTPGAPAAGAPAPAASGAPAPGAPAPIASAPEAPGASAPGGRRARVLVLGCEELMYAPLALAAVLEERAPGVDVRFSTTTRSPVLAVDDPGYAIRTRLVFPAHDDPADGPGDRYAYNVCDVAGGVGFDAVAVVVDSAADTPALHAPDGLLAQLAAHVPRVVLATVPSYVPAPEGVPMPPAPLPEPLRGPAFSSYAPDEVGWLLQDFSDVELEAPTEEREEAVQSGGAHYAESLPVEYQPSDDYQKLFRSALDTSAARIARAVGTVTETVLAERSPRPVLVSLARAGTPVGVLMRRWALHRHGLDVPHYAVSIVRGRGIDTNALRWLRAHHDPADVVFVDGWTGKGAITRELADALRDFPDFHPEIAVLADPGSCVRTYGTREDFLIPSACLNSTVSGLISRTVLRADLVGPGDYHGAKFYRELAGADVSGDFLDTVSDRFDEVAPAVDAGVKELLAADRAPTWEGWAAVERISEEYGIHDVNLVKPGVGETTRVLLRRVPWKVLARRGAGPDLDHVRLLAEQRGVPVEEVDGLPYTCVGLIHPKYTRGATGADGRAVTAP
ncbi:phosphoribosyltransferase domain-containing protein [Streptomyces sp. TRM64462]|uniref:phosphoribosyltransferase domain-containing protein n=1 Tax=Streptomyces sp. TRM64462 TaxID=2741726 RepID=UPI001585E136|nr:phosphoribosyltransferase domain-containing protein [Streptomyces sp. TRM64462]